MKILIQILAIVFLMGTIAKTFSFERVEIVRKHEWELPEYTQDSIQQVQEEGYKAYADYVQLQCEQANSVIGVCKLQLHLKQQVLDILLLIQFF